MRPSGGINVVISSANAANPKARAAEPRAPFERRRSTPKTLVAGGRRRFRRFERLDRRPGLALFRIRPRRRPPSSSDIATETGNKIPGILASLVFVCFFRWLTSIFNDQRRSEIDNRYRQRVTEANDVYDEGKLGEFRLHQDKLCEAWKQYTGEEYIRKGSYLDVMEKEKFSELLWSFVGGRPKVNHFRSTSQVPAETAVSRAVSKELARRGFKFCGPTIVYAFMQAVGMVNDHVVSCHRHAALAKLA